MPGAIKVTEETLPFIEKFGAAAQFDLSYMKYNLEDATYYGHELYLITDGDPARNNRTFTEMWDDDFFRIWKFTEGAPMFPTAFSPIEKL